MNRIKELREEKQLTQVQLAKMLHVHQTAVSQWEQGRTNPSFELFIELCSIFDVDLGYLIGSKDVRGHFHMTAEEMEELGKLEVEELTQAETEKNARIKLLDSFEGLNTLGKAVAAERVEELTRIEEYKNNES